MKYFFSFICWLILCPDVFSDATDGSAGMEPNYTLSVSFDIPHSRLDGMARIAINKGRRTHFRCLESVDTGCNFGRSQD